MRSAYVALEASLKTKSFKYSDQTGAMWSLAGGKRLWSS